MHVFWLRFVVVVAETLAWRRVADLHVMISGAFLAVLGCSIDRERLADILHQEEGRSDCVTLYCWC